MYSIFSSRLIRTLVLCVACGASSISAYAQSEKKTDSRDGHDLQEVVVTGTGTRHLLKDAPVETVVISKKMLENYGGASLQDILTGLTANFEFNEGDMGSQMQMNGLGNNYILVLVDGKRMHGDVGGENDLAMIDPANVEKIEIVRGAHSALYGSDAIAGVVNIITKNRSLAEGFLLENTTRYGSYNDVRQHNGIGIRIGKLQSYTNIQLQHNDGWQNTSLEEAEGKLFTDSYNKTVNKYTNAQIKERLTYSVNKNLELYGEGSYYWKRIYRPQNGTHASFDVYTYDLVYHNNGAAIGGTYKLSKTDFITLDVDWNQHAYYYKYTDTTLEDGYDMFGKPDPSSTTMFPFFAGQRNLQSDQQRTMAQLKGVFLLPYNNQLQTGFEHRYDYLKAPTRTQNGTCSDWTSALYVQDEYTPFPWLNITAGIRLNQNEAFGFRATPKVSAMLSAGDWRFRMGWSEGFKTPTTKELHYRYVKMMGAKTFFYMGNTALRPQLSDYYSANVEYHNNRFSISVTGYQNKLRNMITLVNVSKDEIPAGVTSAYLGDDSGDITPRMYKNMEDARTYGVDVTGSFNVSKELTVGTAYSYLDTKAHVYNDKHHRLESVVIDGMAYHRATWYATYGHRFNDAYRLGIGLYGRMSTKRYYQNDGNGKGYNTWRLSTTHELGNSQKKDGMNYKLEAGVDNIFNYKDTAMHGYHLGTTTAGRTMYVSITVRWNKGKKIQSKFNNIKSNSQNDED